MTIMTAEKGAVALEVGDCFYQAIFTEIWAWLGSGGGPAGIPFKTARALVAEAGKLVQAVTVPFSELSSKTSELQIIRRWGSAPDRSVHSLVLKSTAQCRNAPFVSHLNALIESHSSQQKTQVSHQVVVTITALSLFALLLLTFLSYTKGSSSKSKKSRLRAYERGRFLNSDDNADNNTGLHGDDNDTTTTRRTTVSPV